jgi:hypothetical protein
LLELLSLTTPLPDTLPAHFQAAAGFGLRAQGISGRQCEQGVERVMTMIRCTLQDPRGQWILSQHPEARSEWALLAPDAAQGTRKFVIDRTFVAPPFDHSQGSRVADGSLTSETTVPGTARWIVDYKTSRPVPDESLDAFLMREADHYRGQLAGYQALLATVDKPPIPVRVALYFPALPAWYEIKMSHE